MTEAEVFSVLRYCADYLAKRYCLGETDTLHPDSGLSYGVRSPRGNVLVEQKDPQSPIKLDFRLIGDDEKSICVEMYPDSDRKDIKAHINNAFEDFELICRQIVRAMYDAHK